MANAPGIKLKKSEVSQTIDLKQLFGTDIGISDGLKQVIGQAVIDKIISRTENNKDINGNDLKKYSKEYTESLEFKAFGKSKDDVNMKLSGNMLGTLDILSTSGSKIKIGWDDPDNNAKAYNHNVGDTVKKRAFFGVTSSDLKEIKSEFQDKVDETSGKLQSEADSIKSLILKELGIQKTVRSTNG